MKPEEKQEEWDKALQEASDAWNKAPTEENWRRLHELISNRHDRGRKCSH